jgi:hypothetical protein
MVRNIAPLTHTTLDVLTEHRNKYFHALTPLEVGRERI